MADVRRTTFFLRFERLMKTYLPSIDGFNEAFSEENMAEISSVLKNACAPPAAGRKGSTTDMRGEEIVSAAWARMDKKHNLCPGHVLNLSEDKSQGTDKLRYKIDGSFISDVDKGTIVPGATNWALQRLPVEFKRGGMHLDAFEDRSGKDTKDEEEMEDEEEKGDEAETRRFVRGQLMSHAERVFTYQHRTALFMIFVNGPEFRVIRWDRSGCIVTEALNYVETLEHTKRLLHFLYAFSKMTPEQQGVDTTAVPLSKDSCGWKRMDALSFAHRHDVKELERKITAIPSDFLGPADDPGKSPLFEHGLLHDDPAATCNYQTDHPPRPRCSEIRPVFEYVRTLFQQSVPKGWPRYKVTVDGRVYLIGKSITPSSGLFGRGTRGYIALEWETQRFVFLKDTWRPHYVDLEHEGDMLQKLNTAKVSCVPTLVCHGAVGQQKTEASEYSPITGHKKPDVQGSEAPHDEVKAPERDKSKRHIASLPSRARGSDSVVRTKSSVSEPRRGGASEPLRPSDQRDDKAASDAQRPGDKRDDRGTKRPRLATSETDACDGVGLPPMQHYRIVVAEVCLEVTSFLYGQQLARVIMHCIIAHWQAVESCHILHGDVSAGNILILPTIKSGWIYWTGILSDWELSKFLPGDEEKLKAGQTRRVGTWYFMSIRSVAYPHRPLGIPDELESFLHVIIFLAIRFIRSNCTLSVVHSFINDYFDGVTNQGRNRYTCSETKISTIKQARLRHGNVKIAFMGGAERLGKDDQPLEGDGHPHHPLRDLLADLLKLFQARYAVEEWEARSAQVARAKQTATASPLPSLLPTVASRDGDYQRPPSEIQALNIKRSGARKAKKANVLSEPTKPSEETFEEAEKLDSHDAVLEVFEDYVNSPEIVWPLDDKVEDELQGHQHPDLSANAEWARSTMQSTMLPTRKVDEQPIRAQTDS
ncbi:hypothetical protein DICSQDRAFT_172040 [Dichomitus squalens LYAD-421 SS1]|uniref:Fungal-type protein kinase domain-containing protein n=1 Tax=Dichomitus squalens (strain LYAD-421) TaxID=732165 RepID=R7SWS4_DICSQ|nr:uncharacterized protein DICSQDRAFT_172040 [Dichomitus squalens LYAD-421 SS1]EJF59442.1 hypothetical protein DICSQDRAFT_172040 [Dichomitus squalens LYAD-421 SS1]